jgi:hypothetical protein
MRFKLAFIDELRKLAETVAVDAAVKGKPPVKRPVERRTSVEEQQEAAQSSSA